MSLYPIEDSSASLSKKLALVSFTGYTMCLNIYEFYEHKTSYKHIEAYHFIKLLVVSFRKNNVLYVGDLTHALYPRCACAF